MNNRIYIVLGIFLISLIIGCKKDENVTKQSTVKYFNDIIEVANPHDTILPGDTIWIEADFKDRLVDSYSQESFDLDNSTFIVSGFLNKLKSKFDSLSFLDNNFEIVEDIGEFQIANVVHRIDQISYDFDIRCGKPLESNKLRFGIVANYQAVFAVEFVAMVFFGEERVDYNDFSEENSNGKISLSFNNSDINDSVYYYLPEDYRNYFDGYYNSLDIINKKFYFFNISEN
ncbi:MAG: hypothetical protein PF517_19125 [Salinivirgaceae bacterium]|jgi:hypothetical protein|nr:hypothetical protein [Salinivirgaceae bacterium]